MSQASASDGACLDDNTIALLVEGGDGPELTAARRHLLTCESCRALVGDTASLDEASGESGRVLAPGATLGRYVILETVGAGAMGIVYAAYDPQLSRKVALKRLRPDPSGSLLSSPARGRLLREAQSLARLSHPHVITIHDVGTLGGEIFLAMEFVEGGTLGDWLRAGPHRWREVVALLAQAGEGLAAAHDAGLIHRDLKPENILVGVKGRARVTDFGLARDAGEGAGEGAGPYDSLDPPELTDAAARAQATNPRLTSTGALLGTLGYMAPEQLARAPATALSDQFSFAVTLYEALYGERPFPGSDAASLSASIAAGRVRPAPPGREVPDWLRRIVLRGLEVEPARRFPSMRAMLAALRRGPLVGRRQAALGAGALLAVGLALAVLPSARKDDTLCSGAAQAFGDAWDAARAARVTEAFLKTGRPSAQSAAARVAGALDDEAARWKALHRQTCEATHLRGEQSEQLLDLRMRCLEDRRAEVAALVLLFEQADGALVDRAIGAALSLPPLEPCGTLHAVANGPPLPVEPAARARLARLGGALARANALEYAGRYAEGLAAVAPAVAEAAALSDAPLEARLLLAQGQLHRGAGELERAESVLHEAAAKAQEARDDLTAADAWTALVRITGLNRSRPEQAHVWARYARAALERAGDSDDEREATRLRSLADVLWRSEGKLEEARGKLEEAKARFQKRRSARSELQLASCDEGLAGVLFDMGKPGEALALHQRTLEARERLFGSADPSVAISYVSLGEDLTRLGRAAEAIPLEETALAIATAAGAQATIDQVHHRLAASLRATGQPARALAEDEQALEAAARAGELGSDRESWALTGEGLDLLALGRAAEARAPLERAAAERGPGARAIEIAETRFALARALWESGEKERAGRLAAEAGQLLAPEAARYGSWYATAAQEIGAWRAAHRADAE